MKTAARLPGLVLAGLFLALHLPFLPASLEDLDSINFALGIRDYDVTRHQPHPPGYPLFIGAAKVLHAAGLSEVHALALLSVVAGAMGLVAIGAFFRYLDRDRSDQAFAWIAAAVVATNPLYWLTSARPLSDLPGLAAAMAIQVCALSARTPGAFAMACALAALAAGIRSQVVWLTVPMLVLALARLSPLERLTAAARGAAAFIVGGLLWLVPLIVITGGGRAYRRALFEQGAEDLSGVTMLATVPTLTQLVKALDSALLVPWGYRPAGVVVVALGIIGVMQLWRHARASLLTLTAAFGPYLIFDLLFQETVTTRYALPLVIPAVYLAVRGLSILPDLPAAGFAVALAAYSAFIDDGVLMRYARFEAPVFRMLGDWTAAGPSTTREIGAPVVAMHRREEFDLRRPLQWRADALPPLATRLPAPAKHEWLEVVNYWNSGGRAPVWFVADPLRSDLALIRTDGRPQRYRWGLEPASLLGGSRPSQMDWYILKSPVWYLGEGWSLTPETAGIASEDGRGPGIAPVQAWIRRSDRPVAVMIGGRNLSEVGAASEVRVDVDGRRVGTFSTPPGFFLRWIDLPNLAGTNDYAAISISADNRDLAIEQFDVQRTGYVTVGFGAGWHEQEYNPATGALWRWTSDRATLQVRAEGHALAVSLRGEIEAASSSRVVIRAGDRVVAEFDAGRSFARTVLIPASAVATAETAISIESSASYVPAESRWRSRDRRRLGLKLYECRVTPAS